MNNRKISLIWVELDILSNEELHQSNNYNVVMIQSKATNQEEGRTSAPSASSPPLFKTSDIIDIDDHLDLVETEDGYLPMSCVAPSELPSNRYLI